MFYRGSADATRQAHNLIMALIKDPDKELEQIIPKLKNKIVEKEPLIATPVQQPPQPPPQAIAPTPPPPQSTTLNNISTWDNKMAENIGVNAQQPVSHTGITTPVSKGASASKIANKNSVSISTPPIGSNSNIKTNNQLVKTTNSPLYNIGVFQVPPTQSWAGQPGTITSVTSPKRTSQKVTLISTVPQTLTSNSGPAASIAQARSPSTVSRQLFPTDKKQSCNASTAPKATVTYTMASMAKTKITTSTTATFAAKVENKAPGPARAVPSKSPGVISRPESQQPLPIRHNTPPAGMQQMRPVVSHAVVTTTFTSQTTVSTPAEYSPFNNMFSTQLSDGFLGKKDEQENRMNFASVAAAGVYTSSASQLQSPASRGPSPPQMSESDLAKAPGYKAVQRPNSPTRVMEHDPMKAPGFKGGMNLTNGGNMQALNEMEQVRAPGFNRMNMNMAQNMGQQIISPRSNPSTPNPSQSRVPPMHGPMNFMLAGALADPSGAYLNEYSTPNQPMTLPKIESTLNPNAPHFMSRCQQIQQLVQLQNQMRSQSAVQGQPPGLSATPPPFGMGVSRTPVFHTPPPPSIQANNMANLQLTGMPAAMALGDLPGNSISNLPLSAFQGTMPRQFGPGPVQTVGRPNNNAAMLTSSKGSMHLVKIFHD